MPVHLRMFFPYFGCSLYGMERTIDLVCGMDVDPRTELKTSFQGRTYYFCSPECKSKFDAHPQMYVQNQAEAKQTA